MLDALASPIEYEILRNPDLDDLTNDLNTKAAAGWRAQGVIAVEDLGDISHFYVLISRERENIGGAAGVLS